MSNTARHHYVASQFPLIPFGDKDASVVRIAASEGMLVDLRRRPVVVAVPIFGIESVEPAGKMNRSSPRVATQLKEARRGSGSRVHWLAAIGPAAAGERDGDGSEKSRCRQRAK